LKDKKSNLRRSKRKNEKADDIDINDDT